MLNIDREVLDVIKKALANYVAEVENSDRGRVAKESYAYHSEAFVRWLDGDFDLGREYLQ